MNEYILLDLAQTQTVSALYPTGGGTRLWAKAIHIPRQVSTKCFNKITNFIKYLLIVIIFCLNLFPITFILLILIYFMLYILTDAKFSYT